MSTNDTAAENGHDSSTEHTTEHATVSTTTDTWSGPHAEYDRYGNPTGAEYVRCRECGVEVLNGQQDHATHRTGCRHRE